MRNSRKRSPASYSLRAWASRLSTSGSPSAMQMRGSEMRCCIQRRSSIAQAGLVRIFVEASLGRCRAWSSKPAWGTLCRRWVRLPLASATPNISRYDCLRLQTTLPSLCHGLRANYPIDDSLSSTKAPHQPPVRHADCQVELEVVSLQFHPARSGFSLRELGCGMAGRHWRDAGGIHLPWNLCRILWSDHSVPS